MMTDRIDPALIEKAAQEIEPFLFAPRDRASVAARVAEATIRVVFDDGVST